MEMSKLYELVAKATMLNETDYAFIERVFSSRQLRQQAFWLGERTPAACDRGPTIKRFTIVSATTNRRSFERIRPLVEDLTMELPKGWSFTNDPSIRGMGEDRKDVSIRYASGKHEIYEFKPVTRAQLIIYDRTVP